MKTLRPVIKPFVHPTRLSTAFQRKTADLASVRPTATNHDRYTQQRRNFVSNPFATAQTITASRILPYSPGVIFEVISDVSSYQKFIPYCQESVVTKRSNTAPDGKTYPEEAKLLIGFNNDVSEQFCSRIYCVPESVVEAVSGSTDTALKPEEVRHHSARPPANQDPARNETVLSHLLTRWALRPFPYKPPPASATTPDSTHKNHEETSAVPGQEKTEVNLTIDFQFANPVYAALSQAAAPKVAEKMIEAFEQRVRARKELLG